MGYLIFLVATFGGLAGAVRLSIAIYPMPKDEREGVQIMPWPGTGTDAGASAPKGQAVAQGNVKPATTEETSNSQWGRQDYDGLKLTTQEVELLPPYDINNVQHLTWARPMVLRCLAAEKGIVETIKETWDLSPNGRPNSSYAKARGYLKVWQQQDEGDRMSATESRLYQMIQIKREETDDFGT